MTRACARPSARPISNPVDRAEKSMRFSAAASSRSLPSMVCTRTPRGRDGIDVALQHLDDLGHRGDLRTDVDRGIELERLDDRGVVVDAAEAVHVVIATDPHGWEDPRHRAGRCDREGEIDPSAAVHTTGSPVEQQVAVARKSTVGH